MERLELGRGFMEQLNTDTKGETDMQVTITIDGATLRRATFCTFALGGVLMLSSAHAGSVTIPNSFTAGTQISAAAMNANFTAIDAAVDDNASDIVALQAQVTTLQTLLSGVTRSGNTVVFTGVNVQIKNAGSGTATADGTGNLVLGHNENVRAATRTGSHNLVIGDEYEWTSYAGALAGTGHTVTGQYGVAVGGSANTVTGVGAAQFGGRGNDIDDTSGGSENGDHTACVGGLNGSYAEDDGVAVGTGAAIADVGLDAAVTIIGDASGFVDVGFQSNNVGLGRQATGNVDVGGASNTVSVGLNANGVSVAVGAVQATFKRGKFGGRYAGGYDLQSDGTTEGFEFHIFVQNGFVGTVYSVNATTLNGNVDPTTGAFTGTYFGTNEGVGNVPLTGTFLENGNFTLTGISPVTGNLVTFTLSYLFD